MYYLENGSSVAIQHVLTGSGTANGSPLGYARLLYSVGGVQIRFRARRFGLAGNDLKVALVDVGAGLIIPSTSVKLLADGVTTQVILRRNGGGITATAQEVCDAINNYLPHKPLPVLADIVAAGTLTAGLAATNLTGGLDPLSAKGGLYRFAPAANVNGGLFFFEQSRPWYVETIEGAFDGAATPLSIEVRVTNVTEALDARSGESVVNFAASLTTAPLHFSLTDLRLPLLPNQAIIVTVNAAGVVRCTARPSSGWS